MAALAQTQKEQSRLDKLLTQQQREIRALQREHDATKAGMHTTVQYKYSTYIIMSYRAAGHTRPCTEVGAQTRQ